MSFILAEDRAIKALFTGITVPVANDVDATADGRREVPVRWRYPNEAAKDTAYPFIAITMVSATRDPSREHRGYGDLPYVPDEEGWTADAAGERTYVEFPVPYDLYYSVDAWSVHPQHGQMIFAELLRKKMQLGRFGYVEIPAELTYRRVDLMDQSPAQLTIDPFGKRRHRSSLLIRVASELVPDQIKLLQVQEVVLAGPTVL